MTMIRNAAAAWWVTLLLALGFEIMTAMIIKDGLALNVLMLLYPLEAVMEWQSG